VSLNRLKHKRGIFDIIATLLEILEEGDSNKTALASRASLDTRASNRYIDLILQFNLARKPDRNSFKITDKGRAFLIQYTNLRRFINDRKY